MTFIETGSNYNSNTTQVPGLNLPLCTFCRQTAKAFAKVATTDKPMKLAVWQEVSLIAAKH